MEKTISEKKTIDVCETHFVLLRFFLNFIYLPTTTAGIAVQVHIIYAYAQMKY